MRNIVRHVEHFLHDHTTLLEAFLFIVQFLCIDCPCYKRETRCGN